MAPQQKKTKAELKKEMEALQKKQQEVEEDSDDIDEEEDENDEEVDIEDDGQVDANLEEEEGDDQNEDEEEEEEDDEDEEGDKIPKLKPNSELAEKEESEDEEDNQKEKEELMMNQKGGQPDQAILNMKINDILHVLAKFKENNKENRSRSSYLEELTDYLMQYYNYNRDLIQLFMTMFNPNELVSFLESNEAQRPVTIRTNTLKTRRKELAQILIQRGVNLDTLAEWTKVGLKIYDTKVPIGATPEYLAGHYMLQSASSFLPVIALAPQQNEKVLDMAAAPGGKTTYIAQLMKNTGVLFANDVKADRNKALIFNVQRMGINNCIVTNFDGRKLSKVINNCDRVLLDAPCTGLGIIARDPSVKANKQLIDVQKHSHLQRELILSAIDCCKKGGYIVYSTCSVSVQENESVIDFALKNRFVKLVDMGIEVGEEGYVKYQDKRFDPQLKKTRRILPHVHNMDGFYVAKLKKIENGPKSNKADVQNVNLNVEEKGELLEQNQLNQLKNSKMTIKQGTQGVVEVTANGEDFDWNEEEQEQFVNDSAKKQVLQKSIATKKQEIQKEDKKASKEQKLLGNKKKSQEDKPVQKKEGETQQQSKKQKKIAAKNNEKKSKQVETAPEVAEEEEVKIQLETKNESEVKVKKHKKQEKHEEKNPKQNTKENKNKPLEVDQEQPKKENQDSKKKKIQSQEVVQEQPKKANKESKQKQSGPSEQAVQSNGKKNFEEKKEKFNKKRKGEFKKNKEDGQESEKKKVKTH